MNPFRIKLIDEQRDSAGDVSNSNVARSWSPAYILARISDGSLRLPAAPSPDDALDLPKWSECAGVLNDPGPDDLVLQQALDDAAQVIQAQADVDRDVRITVTTEVDEYSFSDFGLSAQTTQLYGSTVQWNGQNLKFVEVRPEGNEPAKVESTVTQGGFKTGEA